MYTDRKRKANSASEIGSKTARISSGEFQKTFVNSNREIVGLHDRLSDEMMRNFMKCQQDYEASRAKHNLRDALMYVIKEAFPGGGLYIVGSSGNGFGTKNGDLDLCLMISSEEIDQKCEAHRILRIMHRSFRQLKFIDRCFFIRARVPIIKFRDTVSGISCDMNLNNHASVRNTHFLRFYGELDKRVKPLVVCAKVWAKYQDINDASKQTLSSYSLTLMMIHVLQTVKPPVLPVLHQLMPEKFNTKVDIRSLSLSDPLPEWKSMNDMSIGELFVKFLNYYTSEFDFAHEMISVRLGGVLPRPMDNTGAKTDWNYICIEEPFELTNTARSVYTQSGFAHIKRVFKRSYEKVMETKRFESLIQEPC